MRFLPTVLTVALATQGVLASNWFGRSGTDVRTPAYNNWHESELERWLSDHDIPYPTPADRKDLEKLIERNWDNYIVSPYYSWDTERLQSYLKSKGVEAQKGAESSKDSLLSQVQSSWYETSDQAQEAWGSVKDWIFDTWTDSELKAFCDKHDLPVPQPRKRDTLLQTIRSNYETVAQKTNDAISYPGDWLYETWTESDLKEWLDTHGIPAPQPTTRDRLVATVRRNSRLAYLKAQDQAASASSSAAQAYATLTDQIIDAWGESQLKEFADKNGIPVPQGTRLNELRALIRKHRADFLHENVSKKATDAFGAATSSAGNEYARATDKASLAAQEAFNQAVGTWSDSRLKSYLDSRGIPVPQGSKSDELRALVRKHAHRAASGGNAWIYDDMSLENLRAYLAKNGDATAKKLAEKKDATRDELVSAAQSGYASASAAGGAQYASLTSYLAQATQAVKDSAFDTWSESELKNYLDSYGIPVPQGSTTNELRAAARKHYTFFKYGTTTPSGTILTRIGDTFKNTWNWVAGQVGLGAEAAKKNTNEAEEKIRAEL
ncbi:hypothetical protein SODALDRAFT_351987 [Sodiomyces alkalinus F11]|uniref:Stress response protein ish1 n=1 Tax=Sodiomyces alkalinus (strain CBS 110278 / VKM F-3762 / F11) TaxID=1314773 RepID=A0A3N2PQJ9_SODAK|nr:hypothetical protein SODALDRAFT_351987 [Sodiomyces alkalinus F11]ROT36720.1 hypothetical protein SODALDRAFT_351987 [Sodiomyces alkalinus F11]